MKPGSRFSKVIIIVVTVVVALGLVLSTISLPAPS
jgi:putative copper export protein